MEHVHGVDVSWMTKGPPKDKTTKTSSPLPSPLAPGTPDPAQPRTIPSAAPSCHSTAQKGDTGQANAPPEPSEPSTPNASGSPRKLSRSGSVEKHNGPNGATPQRRNSWFSNISAKFSGSSGSPPNNSPSHLHSLHPLHPLPFREQQHPQSQKQETQSQPQTQAQPQSPNLVGEPPPPKLHTTRNAVLPHAAKPEGNGPYTPAPPKSGQAGILGVFRRLSSSAGSGLTNGKLGNGLVERMTLNVDPHRARCPISELKDAKLRRVSFCVDVEIAPMPKYADADADSAQRLPEKSTKKKLTEKGEGEALKNPKAAEANKEAEASAKRQGEPKAKEPVTQRTDADGSLESGTSPLAEKEKETTKKKEKKKKSEEERKARKQKRRRLAEDNGSVPMEIHYDTNESSSDHSGTGEPSPTTTHPTTNPARIYRRCCQLRETPILKKITEQLTDSANSNTKTGIVNKLDLTDYWLQLPDLITLGDYLAVVPVRELVLESCGLSDEGLRVILAGLLAAKRPISSRQRNSMNPMDEQGGVVERVVLKNNKLGPDGWKHISLFLYMSRSLKYLDVSHIPFPMQAPASTGSPLPNGKQIPRSISDVFSRAIADRLGGSTLEMLNIGETEPSMEQLDTIMDGIVKCRVRRLGLAHNHLDGQGVALVAKYLASGKCEGLDLGGNDLRDHMEAIAAALKDKGPDKGHLWALSLAGCNLDHSSLCKIVPTLVRLDCFRFIDLSHNHALFESTPSAVGLLRRYLPKMECLKRIHLQNVNMTSEQAIAIVEVLPEVRSLAHINLLGNTELVKLADARTEEAQEEACALYASLLAATRVSKSLICVDIEVPGDEAGEIVKAMAKQVVAYCLRNMERIPDTNTCATATTATAETLGETQEGKVSSYPDVLAHLVGHDVLDQNSSGDNDSAPDEDYVIGGTGVVKALTCCLKNRGEESGTQSGESTRETEHGETSARSSLAAGAKAKDMSKHLLAGARKIRIRLQPGLNKAKANPSDEQNLRKFMFLDDTLQGIIKRFEDEFPDTREQAAAAPSKAAGEEEAPTAAAGAEDVGVAVSDGEDESEILAPKPLSRSNSVLSKVLAEEEGRVLRVGHRFRSGVWRQEHVDLLSTIDDIGADPKYAHMLEELAEDIGGEMRERVQEKGAARALKEDKDMLFRWMRESDPDHWDRFVESQQKARANINVPASEKSGEVGRQADDSAIAD